MIFILNPEKDTYITNLKTQFNDGSLANFGNAATGDSSIAGFLSASVQLAGNISLNADLGRNAFGVGITAAVPKTPVVATFGITRTDDRSSDDSLVTGIISLGAIRRF